MKDSFTIGVMTSGTGRFRFQAVPTIFMVIVTPIFCGLGLWQLERADQKRELAAVLEMRRTQPPLSLNGEQLSEPVSLLYRHVVAEGHFLNDKSILIENRKHQGKAGFHIITPLMLDDSGPTILVNRGWIAHDQIEQYLNRIATAAKLTIHGEVTIPQPPAIELSQSSQQTDYPPHWPYLTLPHFIDWSGLDVAPFMILQTSSDGQALVRHWPEPQFSDLMHIGYAIQWFAFAIIALLVWLRLSYQKVTSEQ